MRIWKWATLGALAVAFGSMSSPEHAPVGKATNVFAGAVGEVVGIERPRARPFLVRLYWDTLDDRLFAVAASVAFYALLALAPALAVAISLFGLFADPSQLIELPASLKSVLPAETISLVQGEARRLALASNGALSVRLAISLAVSLYSASAAVRSSMDALNQIDEQEETRSFARLYLTAFLATIAGLFGFIAAVAVIGANPSFVALGSFSYETVWLYGLLRWPVFFVFSVIALASLYWIGPSRPPAKFIHLLPGAIVASLLWVVSSSLFGWYVATLGHYTATYGSLATVVVMMTWLWLSAALMLIGAQINYELSPRARRPPRRNGG